MEIKKHLVTQWTGMNVYQSQRWICIQDQNNGKHWFYEPSLSYTRSDSIKKLLGETSISWSDSKKKYGWRCKKIFITLSEI